MPDFWEFPTVSMGLGPITAIYQARFNRYLHDRGLADTGDSRVWAFLGDGETDEPETLGAITLAAREQLDNLDLRHQLQPAAPRRPGARQRQDHPGARGAVPRRRLERHQGDLGRRLGPAAGARTRDGLLVRRMGEVRRRRVPEVHGRRRGDYIREHFFGAYPELLALVADLTDEQAAQAAPRRSRPGEGLRRLPGGRRAPRARRPSSSPRRSRATAWAKPAKDATSPISRRSSTRRSCASSATASAFPIADDELARHALLPTRRRQRGDRVPARAPRRRSAASCRGAASAPSRCRSCPLEWFQRVPRRQRRARGRHDDGVRAAAAEAHVAHRASARSIVPIVPDEARTFGMDALFRKFGIYSHLGQLYEPVDSDVMLYYHEAKTGRSSRRASPRPARWRRSSPPAPPTRRTG